MEFMEGGSLEHFLHDSLKECAIAEEGMKEFDPQWKMRIGLALDVAKGIHAMHSHHPPILHLDLNSRNILVNSSAEKFQDLTV